MTGLKKHQFLNKIITKLSPIIVSDEFFIRLKWLATMDYPLNLNNPQTYNEKINWLKLYDRRKEYTQMVDKLAAKDYVASILGDKYIIPTYSVWQSAKEVDFDSLPNSFVLKTNHDSGGVVICKDKSSFDQVKALKVIDKSLKTNYYLKGREWPYKNIQRCVFAEMYLEDNHLGELRDYKFFCFNGHVKALFIATGRQNRTSETCFDFFDSDFNHLNIVNGHPNASSIPEKPTCFDEMKIIASVLSRGLPCVRIDLYEVNGRVYFGEITFTHWGGFTPFEPKEWDKVFGDWIVLPNKAEQ